MYSASTLFNYPPGKNSSCQRLQRCSLCRLLSASHSPGYVSTVPFFFKGSCCKAIEQVTGSKHGSKLEGFFLFLLCLGIIKGRHPTSELCFRQSFPYHSPNSHFTAIFLLLFLLGSLQPAALLQNPKSKPLPYPLHTNHSVSQHCTRESQWSQELTPYDNRLVWQINFILDISVDNFLLASSS